MKQTKLSVREMCHIAIFTAVIVAFAMMPPIPLPGGVPITLQSWAIALAGLVLGPKNGALAALTYVLLGAAGAPVFAGFTGGMGVILRPTGGFILSFPLVALLAGLGERKDGLRWTVSGLVAGTLVNWLCGMLWLSWVLSVNLQAAFVMAVAPFIIPAALRCALLPAIGAGVKAALRKARMATS